MKRITRFALAASCMAAAFGATAQVPGLGNTCTPSTGTVAMPAPGSGSFTYGALAAYGNIPSQTCVNVSVAPTFTSVNMAITSTEAITYNNISFPACGTTVSMNGGPVYSAFTGTGSFALGASLSGSFEATGYTRMDNVTLTVGGQSFNVSSPLQQFRTRVTVNANGTQDVVICTGAGVATSVNGITQTLPASVWQCLQPGVSGGSNSSTTRVRYETC